MVPFFRITVYGRRSTGDCMLCLLGCRTRRVSPGVLRLVLACRFSSPYVFIFRFACFSFVFGFACIRDEGDGVIVFGNFIIISRLKKGAIPVDECGVTR